MTKLAFSCKLLLVSRQNASDSLCFCDLLVAVDSFDPKRFFEMVGLKAKSAEDVKKAFHVLDADNSGFIEEEELK